MGELFGVGEVAVGKEEPGLGVVRVLIDVVDALRVESAGAADDAVDFIALREQELREIAAVLPGDARNECFFHENPPNRRSRIAKGYYIYARFSTGFRR